eukprot:Protomagalhaensia_wolfi_Nauph_80__839@NODE_1486_length_1506_cov_64_599182_g1152_i0_p2_GENE_NODE_1486_length_1506_cov_64_599182_g1152_i0NODE_1486_length_1506_cov_64_599182_g1152_i0_p2_ORF_typecomplete_len193_score20_77XTBD/PF11952_8/8_2e10_NODE_1486_length_1506_cov_64_599182_g1152_i031579
MKTLISPAQWESQCQFQERLAFLEWYAEREGFGSGSQAAGLSMEDKHRLVSMAQCFANVRFLKTEYASEIMETVEAFYQTRPSARPPPPAQQQPHFHIVRQHERGGRRPYNDQQQYQQNRNNVERRFPRQREERHFNQSAPWQQQQPPWQQQAPPPPTYTPFPAQQRQGKQPGEFPSRGPYQ